MATVMLQLKETSETFLANMAQFLPIPFGMGFFYFYPWRSWITHKTPTLEIVGSNPIRKVKEKKHLLLQVFFSIKRKYFSTTTNSRWLHRLLKFLILIVNFCQRNCQLRTQSWTFDQRKFCHRLFLRRG